MLAAGNLHRLTDERKARYVRAARAEIAMRYDWLARQGGDAQAYDHRARERLRALSMRLTGLA